MRSCMARRPRPTVSPSSTSAARTKAVMIKAVRNSPMTSAATRAMVMESSIVIRRSRMLCQASRKIGQPPPIVPIKPIRLTRGNGSQARSHTAAAAAATNAIRARSVQLELSPVARDRPVVRAPSATTYFKYERMMSTRS